DRRSLQFLAKLLILFAENCLGLQRKSLKNKDQLRFWRPMLYQLSYTPNAAPAASRGSASGKRL
ncbi:MAG: hypothetical protein NW203_05065, partial [Hyphomonadaceae bacterium]|nr:hypothetical protein [Hyphomonadaceae bacterium]